MSKRKDPWSRSFVDRTPSPPSSEDGEENPWEKGSFFSATRDNDLLAELDLSRREDHAIVRETPFSRARLRAHPRSTGTTETPKEFRRSIRTAEDSMRSEDEPFPTEQRDQKESLDWRNQSGWLNAQGDPIPKPAPWIRKGALAKGTTTQIKTSHQPSKRTNIEMTLSKTKAPKKARVKKKTKGASPNDDKVEFHTLPPNVASNPEYPIVAALQRQSSLPRKAKQPRKQTTAKSKRKEKTPPPVQRTLDLDLLIRGGKKKEAVRRKPSYDDLLPTSTRTLTDNKITSSTLKSLSAYAYNTGTPVPQDANTASYAANAKVLVSPVSCPSSPIVQQVTVEVTNSQEQLLPTPPPSSESPIIYVPKPTKVSTIAELEEMAENDYNPATQERGAQLSQKPLPPQSPVPPPIPSLAMRPCMQQISSVSFIDKAASPYEPQLDMRYDQPSNCLPGVPAAYTQNQYDYPMEANPSHNTSLGQKEATLSRSAPSTRSSYQQSRPSSSRWAQLLPSASAETEWSTLTPRRGRLTIPPKTSGTKHSSFRLPMQMFESRQRQPHTDSSYHGSASAGDTVTKVTVWAPTPLRKSHPLLQASSSEPSRKYVPPAMRPLQLASGSRSDHTSAGHHTQSSHELEEDWTAAWARSVNIAAQR